MWDIHKGTCVRLFTGHTRGISALAISPNGRYLASGGKHRALRNFENITFLF